MQSIAEFFYIGGYAWYVWGSYGVTALFMIAEVVMLLRGQRTLRKRLARLVRMNEN